MDASIKSMTGFPSGILAALIVTATLFVTLPLLTRLPTPHTVRTNSQPVLIETQKPPSPPPEKPEKTRNQTMVDRNFIEKDIQPPRVRPNIPNPGSSSLSAGIGGIEIGIVPGLKTMDPTPVPIYRTEEVDRPPRLLRSIPPRYPYLANRDNIEGWVVLRFVVDTEGSAGKLEVVAAEPPGIFEEAALKAVSRYRFTPAVKNGEAVNCVIKQRIRFALD